MTGAGGRRGDPELEAAGATAIRQLDEVVSVRRLSAEADRSRGQNPTRSVHEASITVRSIDPHSAKRLALAPGPSGPVFPADHRSPRRQCAGQLRDLCQLRLAGYTTR